MRRKSGRVTRSVVAVVLGVCYGFLSDFSQAQEVKSGAFGSSGTSEAPKTGPSAAELRRAALGMSARKASKGPIRNRRRSPSRSGAVGQTAITANFILPSLRDQFVTIQGNKFSLGGEVFYAKGANYWPADYGWTAMWSSEAEWANGSMLRIVSDDLKRARDIGSNTVRIIAQWGLFSGPDAPKYHDRLGLVLSKARDNDLKVILTLFDWASNEDMAAENYPKHDAYLAEFARRYGNNPTVFAWDLQNEPDHRYELGTPAPTVRPLVVNFLKRSYAKLKEFNVRQPVSAGLYGHYLVPRGAPSGIADPEGLLQVFDFGMFHWYESPDALRLAINTVSASLGKPILLEELGTPSGGDRWSGSLKDNSCKFERPEYFSPAIQANLFADWGRVIRGAQQKLAGVIVWDLIDHSRLTAEKSYAFCPGDITEYFGMYTIDGKLKPAGEVFKRDFPLYLGRTAASGLVDKVFRETINRSCSPVECPEYVSRVVSDGVSEASLRTSVQNPRERLVRQWYYGYLKRVADDGGLNYYLGRLASGANCRSVGVEFARNIKFQSESGQLLSHEEFVRRLYLGFLGRQPDAGGYAYWVDVLRRNPDRQRMMSDFLNCTEFFARCG